MRSTSWGNTWVKIIVYAIFFRSAALRSTLLLTSKSSLLGVNLRGGGFDSSACYLVILVGNGGARTRSQYAARPTATAGFSKNDLHLAQDRFTGGAHGGPVGSSALCFESRLFPNNTWMGEDYTIGKKPALRHIVHFYLSCSYSTAIYSMYEDILLIFKLCIDGF